jgi:copper chaperone CopZ
VRARGGRGLGAFLRALAIVGSSLLVAPGLARAGIQSATVTVHGMTCPLCTRGVEESIKALDEVGKVTADLSSGAVRVEAREGKSLVLPQIIERVARAGFRVFGEWELVATAKFTIGSERRITLRIPGTTYAYLVLEDGALRRLFQEYPGLKGDFVVGIRIHDHPSWKPPAASITSFEPLPTIPLSKAAAGR